MSVDPKALLEGYLAGALSEAEMQVFIQALHEDALFLRDARQAVEVHGALVTLNAGDANCAELLDALEGALVLDQTSFAFEDALVAEIGSRRRRRRVWSRVLIAAALVVAGGGVLLFGQKEPQSVVAEEVAPERPAAVAALIARDDAVWGPGESRLPIGHGFMPGSYQLDSGSVSLQTASGNLLVVRAPAQFELVAGEQLRLLAGEIGVRIQKGGAYRVRTPGLRIVDLGTEFAVHVDALSQATGLYVFEGAVGLFRELEKPRSAGFDDGMRIVAGTGIRYSPKGGQLESVGGDGSGFIRASQARSQMGISDYGRLVLSQQPTRFWRFEDAVNGIVLCSAGGEGMQLDHGAGLSDSPVNRTLVVSGRRESPTWRGVVANGGLLAGDVAKPPFALSFWFRSDDGSAEKGIIAGLVAPEPLGGGGLQPVSVAVETITKNCDPGMFRVRTLFRETPSVRGGAELVSVMPLRNGAWHHVVYRVTADNLSLWINGSTSVSARVNNARGDVPEHVRLLLGHRSARGLDQRFFGGEIDEVALFENGLSDEMIREQYRVGQKLFGDDE